MTVSFCFYKAIRCFSFHVGLSRISGSKQVNTPVVEISSPLLAFIQSPTSTPLLGHSLSFWIWSPMEQSWKCLPVLSLFPELSASQSDPPQTRGAQSRKNSLSTSEVAGTGADAGHMIPDKDCSLMSRSLSSSAVVLKQVAGFTRGLVKFCLECWSNLRI